MMATGNARGGTPMANEIFEASAGFLVGTGEGAQVLLGGLARKCTVVRSSTPDQRRRAESVDLKLFEPKTMCPFIAVRDCEER